MTTPSHRPTAVLEFLHDTTFADLPAVAVDNGLRWLLDLLGVAAAGSTTDLSQIIRRHVVEHFAAGGRGAPLLFDGRIVSPAGAALANGMTIDAIDAHDGHNLTKGHTGCHQLPALMALVAAEGRTDAEEFLTALIVGYEFATRAGVALHESACDYHTSGAWGAVGCAGLGARILGLDHATSFEALGIAEYHGPRSQMMRVIDHPTMLKDGSGWGAMAGVSAAYLAADGFTGAPAITVNDPALDHIWSDLGSHWIIADQYYKPHPVCRWAQPSVEAALTLRREHDVQTADIERVEVATFHEAARLATAEPETTEQAQYSLPFPVAAVLTRGRLGADEITSGLQDEVIRSLSRRVVITEDDAHNVAFPARRFARVTLVLHDGRRLTSDDTEPRGDPRGELAVGDAEVRAKFHALATPIVGADRAHAIESAIAGLLTAGLDPLLDAITAAP
jgi:2-methylcitrate dehydratase PrpD